MTTIKGQDPKIRGYKIICLLGKGAMGQVFQAFDIKHERQVAIKVMFSHLADPDAKERFLREVQLLKKVNDPNIVTIYANGTCDDGNLYIVMQLILGIEIDKLLKHKGTLRPAQALSIVLQTASGLAHAHKQGIIHRDIKPQNLIIDKDSKRVLIVDFGVAKAFDSKDLTRAGNVFGSPAYLSPEQATTQHMTEKSDIYSLGAVFFKLLTGSSLYKGSSIMEVIVQHVKASIPKLPDSHAKLQPLLDAMCSKDSRDRPSASSTVKIIKTLLAKAEIKALPPLERQVQTAKEKETAIMTQVLREVDDKSPNVEVQQQNRTPLYAFAIVILMLAAFFLMPKPNPLTITSQEQGSTVFVDNQEVGKTPVTLADISLGEHDIFVVKNISPRERLSAHRKINIPDQGEAVHITLNKEFLVNDQWVDKHTYQTFQQSSQANQLLQQAHQALKQDKLFDAEDSAYVLYLQAKSLGKSDPLFIQALDQKAKAQAQGIYKQRGYEALSMYIVNVQASWGQRPWMQLMLAQAQAAVEKVKQEEHKKALLLAQKKVKPKVEVKAKPAYQSSQDCSFCPKVVKLKSFYMVDKPISVAQFSLFLNANKNVPNQYFDTEKAGLFLQNGRWTAQYHSENLPMTYVSHHGAKAYCAWLEDVTDLAYRLPTAQEWEYAARAGTETTFWWGNESKQGMVNVLGITGKDLWSKASPVGSFPANPWKLYDMGGNVWQWTAALERSNEATIKGGSWANMLLDTRPVHALSVNKQQRSSKIGFRCLRSP
ncbi:MAG: bifunctional serine/threonine-protein kinase/formylglycine-generating enzyme family protein [Ghiorsea sp.]|nr:bifunctional serine/threonine-protein kinase/formylglycine-generating enzyme family protein [Ghiorsea sp.]